MRKSGAGDDRVAGGDVVNDVAVIPVEDRAREPLVRGLRSGTGGVGGSSVEVEEIGGVGSVRRGGVIGVAVVVCVGVVSAKDGVVEPIRRRLEWMVVVVRIGTWFRGWVRQYCTQRVVCETLVLLLLLLLLSEMVERKVLGEMMVVVRHIRNTHSLTHSKRPRCSATSSSP